MRNQRGDGKLGCIIWLAIFGAAIFAAVRIIPAKMAVVEFHRYADDQCKLAAVSSSPDSKAIKNSIVKKAGELGLPLDKNNVSVQLGNEIQVKVAHAVTVDLIVHQWVWSYDEAYRHTRY